MFFFTSEQVQKWLENSLPRDALGVLSQRRRRNPLLLALIALNQLETGSQPDHHTYDTEPEEQRQSRGHWLIGPTLYGYIHVTPIRGLRGITPLGRHPPTRS